MAVTRSFRLLETQVNYRIEASALRRSDRVPLGKATNSATSFKRADLKRRISKVRRRKKCRAAAGNLAFYISSRPAWLARRV